VNSGVLHMEDGRQQLGKQLLASDGGSPHDEEAVLPVEAKRHVLLDCQRRQKSVEEAERDDIFRQKSLFGYSAQEECLQIMQRIPLR